MLNLKHRISAENAEISTMKTKLAKAIAITAALQAGVLHALSLGEISVDSAVNEKFDASVRISNAQSLDTSQILVELASGSDFSRADVERPYFLSRLKFEVVSNGGEKVLNISTHDVILEPYMNFLIEVRWPEGRLLREYMVLLDLPTYSGAPAKLVEPPKPLFISTNDGGRVSTKDVAARRAGAVESAPSSNTRAELKPDVSGLNIQTSGATYTVAASQSLWDVAIATRNASSITTTMKQIYAINPEAFVNGDMNQLTSGAVLRLPVGSSVNGAATSVAATSQPTTAPITVSGSTATEAASTVQNEGESGQLTIRTDLNASAQAQSDQPVKASIGQQESEMTSGADASTLNSSLATATSADIAKLENDLARSFENLDRAKFENDELEQRVEAIQQQFNDLERLIELKDQELATLQGALANDSAAPAVTATNSNANAATPATTAPSLIEKVSAALSVTADTLLMLLAGVAAAIIAMVWFLRGRKPESDYEHNVFEPAKAEPVADAAPVETEAAVSQEAVADTTQTNEQADEIMAAADDLVSYDDVVADAETTEDDLYNLDNETLEKRFDDNASSKVNAGDELDELGLSLDLKDDKSQDDEVGDNGLQLAYSADDEKKPQAVEQQERYDADSVDGDNYADEVGTKLDLARAYIDMGDIEGAREILDEVLQEGSEMQVEQANDMISRIA